MNQQEEWRDYPLDKRFKVSNFGGVIFPNGEQKIPRINKDGYFEVDTKENGKSMKRPLHIMVYMTFVRLFIPRGIDVHHINEDKLCNLSWNLEEKEHGRHTTHHHKKEKIPELFKDVN
jgi:hypothetical protein